MVFYPTELVRSGLTVASAMRLDSYAHFRDSRSEAVRARLSNALYHFKGDFLDSLSGDQPKGTINTTHCDWISEIIFLCFHQAFGLCA